MHILGILLVAVQVYFAIHAVRSGNYWWIFIIMAFPLVGPIIYLFAEYLPSRNAGIKFRKMNDHGKPRKIKHLKRELEKTESVKNRINLAEAYYHAGQVDEAIHLLEENLSGINANDLNMLEGLSYAHYQKGNYDKTINYIDRYEKVNGDNLQHKLSLLRAKAYEKSNDMAAALKAYKSITNTYTGEEARCRYAMLLKEKGETEEANALFETILKNAKLYPKQYAKYEKQWVKIAKAEVR